VHHGERLIVWVELWRRLTSNGSRITSLLYSRNQPSCSANRGVTPRRECGRRGNDVWHRGLLVTWRRDCLFFCRCYDRKQIYRPATGVKTADIVTAGLPVAGNSPIPRWIAVSGLGAPMAGAAGSEPRARSLIPHLRGLGLGGGGRHHQEEQNTPSPPLQRRSHGERGAADRGAGSGQSAAPTPTRQSLVPNWRPVSRRGAMATYADREPAAHGMRRRRLLISRASSPSSTDAAPTAMRLQPV
jgi:hypothetical protein